MDELITEVFDMSRDSDLENKLSLFRITKRSVELCLRGKENIPPNELNVLLNVRSTYKKMILAKYINDGCIINFQEKLHEIIHINNVINGSSNKRQKI
jgi:hypothetical protein